MAAFGYLICLLRANVPHRPKEMQRLSSAGDSDDDLLDLIQQLLDSLGSGYHREEKTSEGYRVKLVQRRNRALFVKLNKGPEGAPGETYDLDTEQSIDTTERQAQLSGLRGLFVIPKDSYYGLLFVERVGRRHLRDVLKDTAIRPAGQRAGVVTRVESFAEAKDWEAELAQHEVWRVSEVLELTDSNADASTPGDTRVRVSMEGPRLRQVPQQVKEGILRRFTSREARLDALVAASRLSEKKRKAGKDALTVQDEAELQAVTEEIAAMDAPVEVDQELQQALAGVVPVDREQLTHKSFTVGLGSESAERTFTVESDSVPSFFYDLNGRLSDDGLRDTWLAHAESILRNRGVKLPAGWSTPDKT